MGIYWLTTFNCNLALNFYIEAIFHQHTKHLLCGNALSRRFQALKSRFTRKVTFALILAWDPDLSDIEVAFDFKEWIYHSLFSEVYRSDSPLPLRNCMGQMPTYYNTPLMIRLLKEPEVLPPFDFSKPKLWLRKWSSA